MLVCQLLPLLRPILSFGLPFRVRFSTPEQIRAWTQENGFECVFDRESEMWHVEIYEKAATSGPDGRVAPSLGIH